LFIFALWAWGLSCLLLAANLLTGILLSQSSETSPIVHLLLALGSLFLGLLSHFLLIKQGQRKLELLATQSGLDSKIREDVRLLNKGAQASGFVSLSFLVVSLITGTLAQAGQWPLVHIIAAVAIITFSSQTLIRWVRFQRLSARVLRD